jgi:hypothetical protein
MTSPSPDRAALLAKAERELAFSGSRVIDRRWTSQDDSHELDLLACSPDGTLIVPLITVPDPQGGVQDPGDALDNRIRDARMAAAAWMNEHDVLYKRIRVDLATFFPSPHGGHDLEYTEAVG